MNVIPFERSAIWLTLQYPDIMKRIATALGQMESRIRPSRPKTFVLGFLTVEGTEGSLGWDTIGAAKEIGIVLALKQDGRQTLKLVLTLDTEAKRLVRDIGGDTSQEMDSRSLMYLAGTLTEAWNLGVEEIRERTIPDALPMPPTTKV